MIPATVLGIVAGCRTGPPRLQPDIQSPDAATRIAAIRIAARSDDGQGASIPQLVDRLEDEDAAVRFAAMMALDELTGTRLGYHYGGSFEDRAAAVGRWRRFVVERAGRRAADSQGTLRRLR